jgi:hypothetical protein
VFIIKLQTKLNTMKIEEITLGSWIRFGRKHYLVDEIMLIDILEHYRLFGKIEYKPISLSDIWMSNFGFKTTVVFDKIYYRMSMVEIRKEGNKYYGYPNDFFREIKYVHELQNIFRLDDCNTLELNFYNKHQCNHIRQITCTVNLGNRSRIK